MAKKKKASMTDKELARRLFPKSVRTRLKAVLSELDRRPATAKRAKAKKR